MIETALSMRCHNTLLFVWLLVCGILIPAFDVVAADNSAGSSSYVADFESVPLMPGLTEKTEERVNFDTPAGRIVEATTFGRVRKSQIEKFYFKTLPQLGWQKTGPLIFVREGERLSIEFAAETSAGAKDLQAKQKILIVRFRIKPLVKP